MTRNAENHLRVHMAPFRGLSQYADEEDVGDGHFVDGENIVCTEKPGVILSRPGYNHWKVDENGYGVVYPQPIAILPGGGNVDGIITPPIAIPASENPNGYVPIDGDPPITPENGPTVPVDTPDDPDVEIPPPPPPPPQQGAIMLHATPVVGEVDTGTDLSVNFFIEEDLPDGVTISTYDWDYLLAGGFSADTTDNFTSTSHEYSTGDFNAYDNYFVAAVRGTGSDSIVYTAEAPLHIIDASETAATGQIVISAPDFEAIPADENFTLTVQNYEVNATGELVLTNTDRDVALRQIAGTATLMSSGGSALDSEFPVVPIAFSSTSAMDQILQATLETGQPSGILTVQAVQEGTGWTAERTWNISGAKIQIELVDAAGSALTTQAWSGCETDGDEYVYWEFYATLEAKNSAGATETAFNSDVVLDIQFSEPGGAYGNQWDNDDLSGLVIGRDYNDTYASTSADTDTIGVGGITVDGSFFSDADTGDLGKASVKFKTRKLKTDYAYQSESQDSNSGVGTLTAKASVTGTAAGSYAATEDSMNLEGVHWISITDNTSHNIIDDTAQNFTATLKDVDGDAMTTFTGDFTVSALDDNGATVQVSTDGVTYADSVDVSPTDGAWTGDLYFSTAAATGPIDVAFQVAEADAINGYRPIGVDQVELGSLTLVFVTQPSSVVRGSEFILSIEAQDGDGNILTSADDSATLSLSSTDISDALNTTNISLTSGEWTSGAMQITGGSGSVSGAYITASATGYDSAQTDNFAIGAVSATRSKRFMLGFFAFDSYDGGGGTDPDNDVLVGPAWLQTQADVLTAFDADTSMVGATNFSMNIYEYYTRVYVNALVTMGYISFGLTGDDIANGKDLLLSTDMQFRWYDDSTGQSYYENALITKDYFLDIFLSETSNTFANGSALRNMTPHISYSFDEINALHEAKGNTPGAGTIDLPLNAGAFLPTMLGANIYVWISLRGIPIAYQSKYRYTSGASNYNQVFMGVSTDVSINVKVVT